MLTIIFTSSWNHQLNICSRQEKQNLSISDIGKVFLYCVNSLSTPLHLLLSPVRHLSNQLKRKEKCSYPIDAFYSSSLSLSLFCFCVSSIFIQWRRNSICFRINAFALWLSTILISASGRWVLREKDKILL